MKKVGQFFVAFGKFLYDFIIGDDWKIAVAVVLGLLATAGLMVIAHASGFPLGAVAVIGALIVLAFFVIALVIDLRPKR
jgi:hypothetical protein